MLAVMKGGNIIIPNIGSNITALLQRLKLAPAEPPQDFLARVGTSKHRYYTAARTAAGQTVAFYARLHANPDARRKFQNEITVLGRCNRLPLTVARVMPRLLAHGREPNFEWFTREHITGHPLGHSRHLTAMLKTGMVVPLAQAIAEIGQIPPRSVGLQLPSFNTAWYAIQRQCFGLAQRQAVAAATCRGIGRLVERNRRLLRAENHSLAHGDLNLGNIIVQRGKVHIVDWELAQHNNFAYDIGYLWVHLWQAPRMFRRQLMAAYLERLKPSRLNRFNQLLPVVVAYLAIGGIPYRQHERERKIAQQLRRRYHVALLQNCLKGFSRLINT